MDLSFYYGRQNSWRGVVLEIDRSSYVDAVSRKGQLLSSPRILTFIYFMILLPFVFSDSHQENHDFDIEWLCPSPSNWFINE